jgi:dihydrodipicolinate reductase
MPVRFVVVGSGQLSNYIHGNLAKVGKAMRFPIDSVVHWDSRDSVTEASPIVVHVGSGRELPEVVRYCQASHAPLVQAATGMDYTAFLPASMNFILIEAPNISIPIVKLLFLLQQHGHLFKDYDVAITESHQERKTSLPATAVRMADAFNRPRETITSIRDPARQTSQFGLPEEYLDRHAVHEIVIKEGGCMVTIKSEAYGYDSYLYGIVSVAKGLNLLKNGRYFITDLVRDGII